MGQQAQESNFSQDVTTFSEGDLNDAIKRISSAGENYRDALSKLTGYFDGEIKDAVGGQTLDALKNAYNKRKPGLEQVNNYIDELLSTLRSKTSQGAGLADDLYQKINSNN